MLPGTLRAASFLGTIAPLARRLAVLAFALCACAQPVLAFEFLLEEKTAPPPRSTLWSRKGEPLVDVAKACPGIVIELRYATGKNIARKPIYPTYARCLVREQVAGQLREAHAWLQKQGLGLKIWDAYRPPWAHWQLWERVKNRDSVGDPKTGGSLHSWGAAVDATLVDARGREMKMPTDFDVFSPAARKTYRGGDPVVAKNLRTLQAAMDHAGFLGIRDEWWHFVSRDWASYRSTTVSLGADPAAKPGRAAQSN